jgi:hypothetical protein
MVLRLESRHDEVESLPRQPQFAEAIAGRVQLQWSAIGDEPGRRPECRREMVRDPTCIGDERIRVPHG